MLTGNNQDEKYFWRGSPGKAGDYLEFFAEIDLICGLSTCPGGDLSVSLWGEDPKEKCNPLTIEVFKLDDGLLKGWSSP